MLSAHVGVFGGWAISLCTRPLALRTGLAAGVPCRSDPVFRKRVATIPPHRRGRCALVDLTETTHATGTCIDRGGTHDGVHASENRSE